MIRYFWVLRAYVLRAGELTGLGDDIFFLDVDEIVAALDGPAAGLGRDRRRRGAVRALPGAAALSGA